MTSAFLRTATDGTDPGANMALKNAQTAIAKSGDRRGATRTLYTGTYEGASYPANYNDITYPTVTGTTRNVTAGSASSLQSALNAAVVGDEIVIPIGLANKITGSFTLPVKTGADETPGGNNVVTIRAANINTSLPYGKRFIGASQATRLGLTATDTELLAHIQTSGSGAAFDSNNVAAHGYRFVGLDVTSDPSITSTTAINRIFRLGDGNGALQNTDALTPKNNVIDRCYIHPGHVSTQIRHGVDFQVGNSYIIDSDISGMWEFNNGDSQAATFYNTNGRLSFINTYFEASDEGVIQGGATNSVGNMVDLEYRWCVFGKPASWNPNDPTWDRRVRSIKLSAEIKHGNRSLWEGCYFIGSWVANQNGDALNIKNEYEEVGGTSHTSDIIIRYCEAAKVGSVFRVAGATYAPEPYAVRNVVFAHNEATEEIGTALYDPGSQQGYFMQITATEGVRAVHNTALPLKLYEWLFQGGAADTNGLNNGHVHRDNIYGPVTFASFRTGGISEGVPTLNAMAPSAQVYNNLLVGRSASTMTGSATVSGNAFPANIAAVGFTNVAAGDYSLAGTTQGGGGPAAPFAAAISITTQPTNIPTGNSVTVVARILDQYGANFAATATITATVASGTGTILSGGTKATSSAGVATFSIGLSAPSTTACTLTLSSPLLASATTSSFTITVGVAPAATSLSITTQPTTTASGATMSPAVVVKVLDQFGAAFNSTATITLASASGVATYTGTSAVCAAGVATFASLVPTTATTGSNTLTATSAGLTLATSSTFTVTAPVTRVATSLFISQQPGNGTAGVALSTQPIVKVLDQFGAPIASTLTVTASVASGTAVLTNGVFKQCVNGIATFTETKLTDTVISTNTLLFSAPGLTSVTSNSFTITPVRVATALAMVRQPAGSTSDVALTTQPQVAVVDQFGAIISSSVTITATVGTGSASVTAGATAVASAGTATFAGLTLNAGATNAVTLSFSAPGLTGVASQAFAVTVPAVPVGTSLSITTQPGGSTSGVALTIQPVVRVLDQFGAPITSGVTVTAAVASGSASIAGDTAVASGGIATFAMTLTAGATNAVTLTFTAPGLTSVTSNPVTVTVTPTVRVATALAIQTQPGGASASGVALGTEPVVLVVDQFGAQIASSVTITASVISGTATISSGSTAVAAAGLATFALVLTTSVTNDIALRFTAPGLTGITSALFTLPALVIPPDPDPIPDPTPDPTPDPIVLVATSMRIKVLPTAIISGGLVSPPPEVEILDQNGDVLDIDTTVVTCVATGATVTAGGTDTTADGLAVFTGLVVT